MVDNFKIISELIRNKASKDEFYFLQILKRRKDNPTMLKDMTIIDNLFIKGSQHLLENKDKIIDICIRNNARAYFRLNKRSYKKVALQTLRLIAENIAAENYDIKNCYLSACGQFHSDPNKTWIIDIDTEDVNENELIEYVNSLQPFDNTNKIVARIPTKNGYHLISTPFNVQEFVNKYQGISLHKDNPSILFTP